MKKSLLLTLLSVSLLSVPLVSFEKPALARSQTSKHLNPLFKWAAGLEALKGDGDFRTQSPDEHLAAYYKEGQMLLQKYKTSLYKLDYNQQTLLNYCAHDSKALNLLIQTGFNHQKATFYHSPLTSMIVFQGHQLPYSRQEMPQFEIWAKRLNVNHRDPNSGQSPLHVAVQYTLPDMIRVLLKEGAHINARDKWGNTPLHVFVKKVVPAQNNVRETYHLLLNKGAKPNLKNGAGKTPQDLLKQKPTLLKALK